MNLTITGQELNPDGLSNMEAICGLTRASVSLYRTGLVTVNIRGRFDGERAFTGWDDALNHYHSRPMLCIIRAARDIFSHQLLTI